MIVIYEQDCDQVSILDTIEDDELENYTEYYKKHLLKNENILNVIGTHVYENSIKFKVIMNYSIPTPDDMWLYFNKTGDVNKFKKSTEKKVMAKFNGGESFQIATIEDGTKFQLILKEGQIGFNNGENNFTLFID